MRTPLRQADGDGEVTAEWARARRWTQVDETRPMNQLTIKGEFSLVEIHSWVIFCVPEIPTRPPSEEVYYTFQSVLMGTT